MSGGAHSGPGILDERIGKPTGCRRAGHDLEHGRTGPGGERPVCEEPAADRRDGPRNAHPTCDQPPLLTQPTCGDEPSRRAPVGARTNLERWCVTRLDANDRELLPGR
jgi:hypothetical protein